MSYFDCKCGHKPASHWHNKETGEIEGYLTTIGKSSDNDVQLTEDEVMLLAEKALFPKEKVKKS